MLWSFVGFLILSALALGPLPDQTAPSISRDPPSPESASGSHDQGLAKLDPRSVLARAKFPEAKRRFLKGLPRGYKLYVLSVVGGIPDVVEKIESGKIFGRWPENVQAVDYEERTRVYTYPEEDMADWAIVRPDGVTEAGDFTGMAIRENVRMILLRPGNGKTCDDARRVLDSAAEKGAVSLCARLGARLCPDGAGVFILSPCQWSKDIQSYQVEGVGFFGCCPYSKRRD